MIGRAAGVDLRPGSEGDHARIVAVADEWFAGRRVRQLLPRAWFRHFGSTSLIASAGGGSPVGFLVGFFSPDRPDEAVIHLLAVHPSHRRRGIGRALIDAFGAVAAARGRTRSTTLVWPDEPAALAFLRGVGFEAETGPDTRKVYGQPAIPDYDGDGEDRVLFGRSIG